MPILRMEGIQASYGDLVVLREVSLHLEEGEIVAVVGIVFRHAALTSG